MTTSRTCMRCDLHVHSRHSGPVDLPGLRPLRATSRTRSRARSTTRRAGAGMDLVTLTDHDSIAGALELARPARARS